MRSVLLVLVGLVIGLVFGYLSTPTLHLMVDVYRAERSYGASIYESAKRALRAARGRTRF